MPAFSLETARRLLCALQDHIRLSLEKARTKQAKRFSSIAAVTTADTIYHIDRISEEAITAWFEEHWPAAAPVQVVMEGVEDDCPMTFPRGTPVRSTQWKCILDPIDGTRGLMFDKRSAWALAGLAPQRGAATHLGDIVVAVMTELPPSKQGQVDQYSAIKGKGVRGTRLTLHDQTRRPLRAALSPSRKFEHGFSSFARFLPSGLTWLSDLEETFWRTLLPTTTDSVGPIIFTDQYISTGGQLAEILSGHDRMIADVRPYAYAALGIKKGLVCHPYDICTALLLTEAGGLMDDGMGRSLRAPLNTTHPVSWVAYANPHLARLGRPLLKRLLRERGAVPSR